ncbi:MAG: LacI family transcriptional regulator [Phycisphaerae bacterium]|nr:LacI family transcriptional regulator [Phycisphaerae bacterium]
MSITVSDIAKKAAVSTGTVSRVLNNKSNVGSDHKQRVLSAMAELDYRPNLYARGMRTNPTKQKTGQIAMVFINRPDYVMHTAYTMQYIHGVQQKIDAAGRKCLFITWNEKPGDDTIPPVLLDGDIDGVVVKGQASTEIGKQWLSRYPRVILNPTPTSALPDCDCVRADYEAGIRDCVAYLASLGHRRIAFVHIKTFHCAKLLGYRRAIDEFGLDVDEGLIQTRHILPPLQSDSELDWAIDNLWSLSEPPTAILSNDYFCSAIYHALAKRGLKVPDDVSVIGYDNDISCCETLRPKLTSVDIEAVELGKLAVKQLLDRIQNPQESYRKICTRSKIVERESVRKL